MRAPPLPSPPLPSPPPPPPRAAATPSPPPPGAALSGGAGGVGVGRRATAAGRGRGFAGGAAGGAGAGAGAGSLAGPPPPTPPTSATGIATSGGRSVTRWPRSTTPSTSACSSADATIEASSRLAPDIGPVSARRTAPARSLPARREVEVGRRRVGELPLDVGLVAQLVKRVGRFHRFVERSLDGGEILPGDRLLERLPVLGEELVQVLLVLGPREGGELHEAADLLRLEARERPVPRLGGVEHLPGARPDLGHDASEAGLDDGDVLERHLPVTAPHRDVLQRLLIGHPQGSSEGRHIWKAPGGASMRRRARAAAPPRCRPWTRARRSRARRLPRGGGRRARVHRPGTPPRRPPRRPAPAPARAHGERRGAHPSPRRARWRARAARRRPGCRRGRREARGAHPRKQAAGRARGGGWRSPEGEPRNCLFQDVSRGRSAARCERRRSCPSSAPRATPRG